MIGRIKRIFQKRDPKYPSCQRCGLCCIAGICEFGAKEEQSGLCVFLTVEDDQACCELVKNGHAGVMTYIGVGCIPGGHTEIYELTCKVVCDGMNPVEFIKERKNVRANNVRI